MKIYEFRAVDSEKVLRDTVESLCSKFQRECSKPERRTVGTKYERINKIKKCTRNQLE